MARAAPHGANQPPKIVIVKKIIQGGHAGHHGGVRGLSDVVGGLDGGVQEFAHHRDAEAEEETHHGSQHEVAQRLRRDRIPRQAGGVDDGGLEDRVRTSGGCLEFGDEISQLDAERLSKALRFLPSLVSRSMKSSIRPTLRSTAEPSGAPSASIAHA